MVEFKNPISLGGLAKYIGVPRQRIYNLVRRKLLHPYPLAGTLVVSPAEAALLVDAVVHVRTKTGARIRFDFV